MPNLIKSNNKWITAITLWTNVVVQRINQNESEGKTLDASQNIGRALGRKPKARAAIWISRLLAPAPTLIGWNHEKGGRSEHPGAAYINCAHVIYCMFVTSNSKWAYTYTMYVNMHVIKVLYKVRYYACKTTYIICICLCNKSKINVFMVAITAQVKHC